MKNAFLASAALLLAVIGGIVAQNIPCTTPNNLPGMCVPVMRCRNIFAAIQMKDKLTAPMLNFIRRSVCQYPNVNYAVCCRLSELGAGSGSGSAPSGGTSTVGASSLLPSDCGTMESDRISFGNLTQAFEFPWMALLRYRNFNGELVDGCGGSLINDRYVLTAAHCLIAKRLQLDHVRLGEHNKETEPDCVDSDDCAGPVQDVPVEKIIIHPEYNKPKYRNDIGLIRLVRKVTFEYHIKPICLPVNNQLQTMTHSKYILTGWGTTEENVQSQVLLKASVPQLDNESCERILLANNLKIELFEKQMCAGAQGLVDSCQGDSGGPLGTIATLNNQARFVQFGIVSIGINSCGQKPVPSIYTKVAPYMSWIVTNLKPSR
ncbi:serine protease grass-like [Uranotaenia lowii]|uniref:serine protease grass-like n=1 Tax=Uranotaenia lowii TaxID=190385 RepID=UPI00247862CC|nr:serine protease grass-like [Uranotaenia lowii]